METRVMAVTSTPIGTSVHQHDVNPLYGEGVTHVLLEDNAAGAYILLKQCDEHSKVGEIRLDIEELEAVLVAARDLIENYPDEVAG
jgi:hypothetical protein